jgi:hypothetical protein
MAWGDSQGDLQDLYRHLDHPVMGTRLMAWYGQCRAQGMTHRAAVDDTVREYGLTNQDWYVKRMAARA